MQNNSSTCVYFLATPFTFFDERRSVPVLAFSSITSMPCGRADKAGTAFHYRIQTGSPSLDKVQCKRRG